MSSGVSGTRKTAAQASGRAASANNSPVTQRVISAAKVTDLENEHQKLLNTMKSGNYTLWDEGAESGARAILGNLAGKKYSVSGYKLTEIATFDPLSVKEVETNLDKAIQGYKNRVHDQWNDGYYSQAVLTLEKATGNKYSVEGYKLKKVST